LPWIDRFARLNRFRGLMIIWSFSCSGIWYTHW